MNQGDNLERVEPQFERIVAEDNLRWRPTLKLIRSIQLLKILRQPLRYASKGKRPKADKST